MARGIFLDPLKTPANTGFPPTPDELLRFIAQYMAVKGLEDITGIQLQEDKPGNTDLPWLAIDSTGKPLGLFVFHNGIWTSVEHEKGDLKYQNLTGAIHPHWRIADDSITAGPINGVTIPTITDRGLVAAAAGGKYNVGDTGGSDDFTLSEANLPAHLHGVNINATATSAGAHNHDSPMHPDGQGGTGRDVSYILDSNFDAFKTSTDGAHTHPVPVVGNTANTGGGQSFDNRSQFYGARLLIYVGVE